MVICDQRSLLCVVIVLWHHESRPCKMDSLIDKCVCDGSSNGLFPVSLSSDLPICCDISVEIRLVDKLTVACKWPLSVQEKEESHVSHSESKARNEAE